MVEFHFEGALRFIFNHSFGLKIKSEPAVHFFRGAVVAIELGAVLQKLGFLWCSCVVKVVRLGVNLQGQYGK